MERKVKLVRFSACVWNESHTFGIVMCKQNAEFSFSGLPAFCRIPGHAGPFPTGSGDSEGAPGKRKLESPAQAAGSRSASPVTRVWTLVS